MKLKLSILALAAASLGSAFGQSSYTSTSATGLWFSSRWNNTADAAPYTSAFTANNAASFASGTYTFTGGGTGNVGNVTLADNTTVTFSAASGTLATGGLVRTITVGTGSLLDFNTNAFSTATGTGFIKNGAGVLATAGGGYSGGFTLNAGSLIMRGVDAMGGSATNVLTLNGGVVASNATRSPANTKYGGGIVIGGNVQFGELATNVALANSSANLSFANNVSLGNATRTLTVGNNGEQTFSGVISNTGTGGITFAANAATDGQFRITNAANTFTGNTTINGGEVRFTTNGSMGNAANDIIIDGGRFATASGATFTLGAGRDITIGDAAGTSISTPGAGVFTINNAIANISGKTGSWAKQGGGTLELGGVSTYTGGTAINNGILRLTTGSDRLPTGTVVSLGQAASGNVGTLDLNGRNQTIAGLNSTTGTNASVNTNVVTSAAASTLTINASTSTTHVYSGGTAANSGVISGAVSFVKEGEGTQVLGGANSYTGTTGVNAGILLIEGSHTGGDSYTVDSNGAIGGNGSINSSLFIAAGGGFVFNPLSTLMVNGASVTFGGFSITDLIGLNGTVLDDTYTLIDGAATIDFTNVANLGLANAVSIGGGKSAYFESGSLNLVVIPEPSAALLGGLGMLVLLRRRHC